MQSVGLEHCTVLADRATAAYGSVDALSSIAISI